MQLRKTSRYGALDDRRVVAAMGAALHEELDQRTSDSAPEWVLVDLPNAFRSYFDGLLHASLLRWTSSARVWWGTPNECESLIDELEGRFHDKSDWLLLLAELLLAAAEGKLPRRGVTLLLLHADRALEAATTDEEPADGGAGHPLGFVELGRILVLNLLDLEGVAAAPASATAPSA
jgi:hypothetical protein